MCDVKRHGKKWTITEVLRLQREYELLNLSVAEMAKNHKRSVASIIYKLESEGFITSLDKTTNDLKNKSSKRSFPVKKSQDKSNSITDKTRNDEMDLETDADSSSDYDDNDSFVSDNDDSDYEDEEFDMKTKEASVDTISDRVWSLETNVQQISSMVKQMFNQMISTEKKTKAVKINK
jgi:ABC-type antimicrobial peptide transport system permease subunit